MLSVGGSHNAGITWSRTTRLSISKLSVVSTVAQSFCATRAQIIAKVMLPASVPFMLTGIRLGIGRGIVGVVVGELFGARAGLGYLIFTAGQTFDVPALFVGILTLAAMGVGLTFAAQLVERRALRWRRAVDMD